MINFKNVSFVKSAPTLKERPELLLKEVCFVGKSNVGKSTLINLLTQRKSLAFVSSKPGHTKLLNYYLVDNKFYLVDAPGYGYTEKGSKYDSSFGEMMESYFNNNELALVVFLIDSRREPSVEDLSFYSFLKEKNINVVVCFTKSDKLNQSERAKAKKTSLGKDALFISNQDLKSITNLESIISSYLK